MSPSTRRNAAPVPIGGRPPGRAYQVPKVHQDGLSSNFDALEQDMFQYRTELTKFLSGGNQSAAIRARKALSNIMRLAQMGREGIQVARDACVVIGTEDT